MLLALLLLGPSASAQIVDPQEPPPDPTEQQPPPPPVNISLDRYDVLEGTPVQMRVRGWSNGDQIEVRCTDSAANPCPDRDQRWRAAAQDRLTFPAHFGGTAAHQPRFNTTYEVRLVKGGVALNPPLASFHAWIADLYRFQDRQIEPGDVLNVGSSGYTSDVPVNVKLTKSNSSRAQEDEVLELPALSPQDGFVGARIRFSPNLAEKVRCPSDPFERCRDFHLRITQGGKPAETLHFYVRPAVLNLTPQSQPSPETGAPAQVPRTANVEATYRLAYRGGFEFLTWLDYGYQKPGPKFVVERVGIGNPVVVYNGSAKWSDTAFGWAINWSIPRDAAASNAFTYRFVVIDQFDPYKNDIRRFEFRPFQVVPYEIPLAWDATPTVLERNARGRFDFDLRYGDGRSVTPVELGDAKPRACVFPRSELRDVDPCFGRPTIDASYIGSEAVWRITNTWPLDEPRVDQDWVLAPAWSTASPLLDADGNSVRSEPIVIFNLTTARPRITLVTAVGDEVREGARPLERGDVVKITAHVTYPDGKTPFNRTRNQWGNGLPLQVFERNSAGDVIAIREINLTNPDNRQTWFGQFTLGRSVSETPAGAWEFRIETKDRFKPANANVTVFRRDVVPATILVTTLDEPRPSALLGETVSYRFKLNYRDGTRVTGEDVGLSVRAEVRPIRGPLGLELGAPVATLAPRWDTERGEWVAEWRIPRSAALEKYVIVPSGRDLNGNVVRSDVFSRPILVVTETFQRAVLHEPPVRAPRGERVAVIFEGRDGDVGLENVGKPLVVVERYDGASQRWVAEVLNVRSSEEPGVEHTGLWNTTLQTQAGLYRFRLVGKDASFAFINGTSRSFVLEAVKVDRLSLTNGTNLTKGDVITAAIEKKEGDSVVDAYALVDGKRGETIYNRKTYSDRIEVSYTVPFTFPTGAFTVVVESRDRNGNRAFGEVGPFFVSSSEVRSESLADPLRIVQRSKTTEWTFRSFYPNGAKLDGRSGLPDVTVIGPDGPVASAKVRNDGPNYVASWDVPNDAPATDHWFEIGGRDAFGNSFIDLRSRPFKVEPGVVGRVIKQLPPTPNPRDVLTAFQVFTDPDDREVEYSVVRLRAETAQAALNNFNGQVIQRGQVQISDDGTYWLAEWRPPKDAPLGWYRFRIDGTDRHGNQIEQWSGAWQMAPSQLPVFFDRQPGPIEPGQPWTTSFEITYPDRQRLDAANARVSAQVLRNDQAMPPEVVVTANGTVWTATWATPEVIPEGRYRFVISGFDILGNTILRTGTTSVDYAVGNLEKLFGVPAPGALTALAAVAVGAALAGRRRARS